MLLNNVEVHFTSDAFGTAKQIAKQKTERQIVIGWKQQKPSNRHHLDGASLYIL
jgi:hypothetical protein